MEENSKSTDGILEKLAMITDATQQIFPDGKSLIIFELQNNDFKKVQDHFRKIDNNYRKFVVDISGVEVVFILENTMEEEKIEEKQSFLVNIKNRLFRKGGKSSIKS
jgi:hypothetical protein